MPSKYIKKVAKRSYTHSKKVKKPYGTRYGNDAFVKVEVINSIASVGPGSNEFFSTMRTNAPFNILDPNSTAGNSYIYG